jgi:hypothetical protein
MKRNLFLAMSAAALLLSECASTKVDKQFYSPKQPKYSIDLDKEGRKSGVELWWYPNGNRKYEGTNRGGVREGKYTAWYQDGSIWYQGYEWHGKPESTLTYWYPNGKVKSEALFRDGIQLKRKDYDDQGNPIEPFASEKARSVPALTDEQVATEETARLRKAGLQMWGMRVRQTVESFWVLPKQFEKERPYRAVAKIKVGKDGKILGVTWLERSPSAAFNTLAQNTFRRIKRLPAFPPQITESSLEVQYEFISLGKPAPRKKLEVRGGASESE